jgi:DNA-directed RNA polymerase specialized sigma24 family protein
MATTTGDRSPIEPEYSAFCTALYVLIRKVARSAIEDPTVWDDVSHDAWIHTIPHRHKLALWEDYQRLGYIRTVVKRHHWRLSRQHSWIRLMEYVEDKHGQRHQLVELLGDARYEPSRVLLEWLEWLESSNGALILAGAEEVLTENQFDVLVLRLEGKTFKEIGALLGRSEVACRKSWSQICKKLKLWLQIRKQWRDDTP